MLATTVPPTTHSLAKTQRLRLMRSTRKLTALLGATPLLIDSREPPPMPPPGSSPSPTLASVPAGSQPEESHTPECDAPVLLPVASPDASERPTLLLRINTAPSHTGAGRRRLSSSLQERARPVSLLVSPVSSTFDFGTEGEADAAADARNAAAARRRKMARVARTLGDGVPQELVFQGASLRNSDVSDTTTENSGKVEYLTLKAQYTSGSKASMDTVSSPSASRRPSTVGSQERADSVKELPPTLPLPLPTKSSTKTHDSMTCSPVSPERVWFSTGLSRSSSQQRRQGATVRTERGWIGEWNQDVKTVVKGLRELKA